jgi:ribosome-associated translation inhibitor RaiA
MRPNIEFKNVTAKEELSKLAEELAAKIEKRVKSFPQETVYLRLFIGESATNKPWTVSATLELPGKTIAAKEEARDAHTAIRAVFAELEQLIDAYKSSLRGEPSWKRQSRRKRLREQKAGTAAAKQEDGGAFFSIVGPHIAALSDSVGHLLGYAEARGDLVPGEVTAEDIVDQTCCALMTSSIGGRPRATSGRGLTGWPRGSFTRRSGARPKSALESCTWSSQFGRSPRSGK